MGRCAGADVDRRRHYRLWRACCGEDSSALERCLRTGAASGLDGDAMVKDCEREVLEWTHECERLNANDARGAAELCAWSVIDMGHDAQDAADLKGLVE